jgi:MoaA/NifB/PqqE/SkfB family radical SAM enzyme
VRNLVEGTLGAWGRILVGRYPILSIEITRECPLTCPGCYAYGEDHLGGPTLRELRDYKGQELVDRMLALVDHHRPVQLSIVGGEPLVRYRELNVILPELARRGIFTQVVTSAVRPIPTEWASIPRVQICVSIDGLQPEHDERRKPATYDRILKHIEGHRIIVHCTVTRQQARRHGYLEQFLQFWSAQPTVRTVWFSLYTPQIGELSAERLTADDRALVLEELEILRHRYPKLDCRRGVIEGYAQPPQSPEECIFARTTTCVSADFRTPITPCQYGGRPDCTSCGCMASAGFAAVGRYHLGLGLRAGHIFEASFAMGRVVRKVRAAAGRPLPDAAQPAVPGLPDSV